MADEFDFKAATPDTTVSTDAYLMGADSQSATDPSLYQIKNVLGGPRLTADTTFYVRTDGSDSNDGLANTAGGAWLTPQHAADQMAFVDANGYTVQIQINDGTYNGPVSEVMSVLFRPRNCPTFTIRGNPTTPGNVVFDAVDNTTNAAFMVGRSDANGSVNPCIVDTVAGIRFKNGYVGANVGLYSTIFALNFCEFEGNDIDIYFDGFGYLFASGIELYGDRNTVVSADSFSKGFIGNLTADAGATFQTVVANLTNTSNMQFYNPTWTNLTAGGGAAQWSVDAFCKLDTGGSTLPGAAGTADALGKVI